MLSISRTGRLASLWFVAGVLALAPTPAPKQARAADWDFFREDGADANEAKRRGKTGRAPAAAGGDWAAWETPPEPGDEGDDFTEKTTAHRELPPEASRVYVEPGSHKATWLNDPLLGLPYCQVVTPGDWAVSGRPIWSARHAVKPWTSCLVVEIPRLGASSVLIAPYAELAWREGRVGGMTVGLPDGAFDTDTGTPVRRYRDAETVLREFIAPALASAVPGFRPVSIRATNRNVDKLEPLLRQRVEQLAHTGNRIAGQDAGAAEMRFAWTAPGGVSMEGKAETLVYGVHFAGNRTVNTRWSVVTLNLAFWPAAHREAERLLDGDGTLYAVRMNPQWLRAADQVAAAIRQKSADVLTRVHEMSRRSFREAQEVRYRLEDKFRRALTQESVYQAPDGATRLAPNTANHAYVNAATGEAFATEREVPPGALPFGFDPMQLVER